LDHLDSPQRLQVNNAWMASPYLPVSQVLFAAVYRGAPGNPLACQVAAMLLDLLTGWLVMDMLSRLNLPQVRVLLYLWNPLIVVEFAHGAHVDALMICLMMLSLWALVAERQGGSGFRLWLLQLVSPVALAAATLTKGIPALLLPVVIWPWGGRRTLICLTLIFVVLLPVGLDAGFGLVGQRDGEGLFGALRIYGARWNYNGGLYHWLEVAVSGYPTPGAVPPDVVGETPIRAAKLIAGMLLTAVLALTAWWARRCQDTLCLLRSAVIPLGAYLLLTTTVHPWYVAIVVPLLAFLLHREGEEPERDRLIWPWIYLSVAVSLSYLTYLDPANLREYDWVRLLEYLPFYLLLIWAAWSSINIDSSASPST
jgi:alpha-1,6-mannosyltransferase